MRAKAGGGGHRLRWERREKRASAPVEDHARGWHNDAGGATSEDGRRQETSRDEGTRRKSGRGGRRDCRGGGEELWLGRAGGVQGRTLAGEGWRRAGEELRPGRAGRVQGRHGREEATVCRASVGEEKLAAARRGGAACRGGVGERISCGSACG